MTFVYLSTTLAMAGSSIHSSAFVIKVNSCLHHVFHILPLLKMTVLLACFVNWQSKVDVSSNEASACSAGTPWGNFAKP